MGSFTKYEALILSDFDGTKTKDLIKQFDLFPKVFQEQIADHGDAGARSGEEVVNSAASILKFVWQQAHNRPLV
jgi:hypothetical protein